MATGPSARGKQGMVQEESNGMQLLNFEFAVAGWFQISSFLQFSPVFSSFLQFQLFQISMSSIFAPTSNLLQQAHGQDVRGGLGGFAAQNGGY